MRILKRAWIWFDDLTGISSSRCPLLDHPVPKARKSAWFYVLGSATLIAFLIQVVTGIALASGYVAVLRPSLRHAAIHFRHRLRADRTRNPLLRRLGDDYPDRTAHDSRLLDGSYKYPRQMNWLSGVALLLLTLAMAFTGQLLRWDQTGFWSVLIAAEQAGRVPFIGNWLGHFILAGDTVGGATLSRFFVAHVFFFPASFSFLSASISISSSTTESPSLRLPADPVDPKTYRPWFHALLAREGEPFWPDAAWRDVVFGFLVVLTVVGLAIVVGPPDVGQATRPDHCRSYASAGVVFPLVLRHSLSHSEMVGRSGDGLGASDLRSCADSASFCGAQRSAQSAAAPMVVRHRGSDSVHDCVLWRGGQNSAVVAPNGGACRCLPRSSA